MIYPNTALIESKTDAQTAEGTANPTYSTRIASLTCSVQRKKANTSNSFSKETLVNEYRLYTPIDTDSLAIDETDRVTSGGKVFEITGKADGAGQGHHLEIDMLEVK